MSTVGLSVCQVARTPFVHVSGPAGESCLQKNIRSFDLHEADCDQCVKDIPKEGAQNSNLIMFVT